MLLLNKFFLFLAAQRRYMLETASIAGGATIAVLLVVILCVVVYLHYNRRTKATRTGTDCVDSSNSRNNFTNHTPTFGTRWRTNPQSTDLPVRLQDRGDIKPQNLQQQQQQQHQKQLHQSKVELHHVTTLLPSTNEP